MTQHTKETMTPAQLLLRVVGVAFASVVLFALLAVLGQGGGTAEAADHPAGLGDLLGPWCDRQRVGSDRRAGRRCRDADPAATDPRRAPARPPAGHAPVLQNLTPVVTPITDRRHTGRRHRWPRRRTGHRHRRHRSSHPVDRRRRTGRRTVGVTSSHRSSIHRSGRRSRRDPVGPGRRARSSIPVVPVVAPVTDGIQPDVDTVVPPATAGPDSEATASAGSTAAPDPAAEPTARIDGDGGRAGRRRRTRSETPAAAVPGVRIRRFAGR